MAKAKNTELIVDMKFNTTSMIEQLDALSKWAAELLEATEDALIALRPKKFVEPAWHKAITGKDRKEGREGCEYCAALDAEEALDA